MRTVLKSLRHAGSLLRNLGVRRFAIVVGFWVLRRHRRVAAPALRWVGRSARSAGVARDPVLVYQMSKVGSTSLVYSLQYAYLRAGLADVPVRHVHTLTNLDLHERNARQANDPPAQFALLREYRQIRDQFDADPGGHWNVIGMVRDPVARHVSDFFHHADRHLPGWRRAWRDGTLTADAVMRRFLAADDHAHAWFDAEFGSVLGIDVFASPFPHAQGYQLYACPPKVSAAVIRLEDMDRVAGRAVGRLLGVADFRLYPFNAGSDGDYAGLYAAFKRLPIPGAYLENAYSGRLARHFYSDAERAGFARRWSAPGSSVG